MTEYEKGYSDGAAAGSDSEKNRIIDLINAEPVVLDSFEKHYITGLIQKSSVCKYQ